MNFDISSFKAYDIRGKVPSQLNSRLCFCLGCAISNVISAKTMCIGMDARLSGESLKNALISGAVSQGVKVSDIGLCGTEEIYYALQSHPFDIGIMITGSHNPKDENGIKMVKSGAVPISGDSGLKLIKDRCIELDASLQLIDNDEAKNKCAPRECVSFRDEYIDFLLDYVKISDSYQGRRLKIHVDAGNGCAGLVLEKLCPRLPYDFSYANMNPDGNFPNGLPNPLLPERRSATSKAVLEMKSDIGVAWDGDFDRCFFFDEHGNFIEGYYLVGLIAESLLSIHPKEKIIHDPRLYWNTREVVNKAGGIPILSKTGHAFIKERMRLDDALYGGEMSAHHYFRDFAYCDSGMIPFLLVAKLLAESGKPFSELVSGRMSAYPCSGEINRSVEDADATIDLVRTKYSPKAIHEDSIDGLSLEFDNWRFNLRKSNTEPLVRLNVETRGDVHLMETKTAELLDLIGGKA